MSIPALHGFLGAVDAVLPSEREVRHLAARHNWPAIVRQLSLAGFSEVVIKLGARGSILAGPSGDIDEIAPADALPRDLTGAGDAFCGAYAACRLSGHPPVEAAKRASVAAAMVIETEGADEALALTAQEAQHRLAEEPSPVGFHARRKTGMA